ncbi:deoxyribose-phosphate aldolase [Arthrobacter sp. AFG20]|jgi:deoxyribose-phosphate aldolase|uniref:deoxyribose-phosphate aldolase n=1 Tax=Arthrobacter sp. AFG20 TaxID=1688671 RepID=UPI000C9DEB97|nr:deoxyribose-phosphate aldolase [Arthrobacter sp. AFG20]PNH78927.1 deoxyribose-phosphate aldolase [Arthrobacter sp. AFG20]
MIKIRGKEITAQSFARMLDISLVHPDTTLASIKDLVSLCLEYNVNACCVNPNYLDYIVSELKGTNTKANVVTDYPFGTSTLPVKVAAVQDAVRRGAQLIDPVVEFGALKNGEYAKVTKEVTELVKAAEGLETRFIVEVSYLTPDEIVAACNAVVEGGGNYVKTSTGREGGPDMSTMKLMKDTLEGTGVKIKLAGTGRFWTTGVALGAIAAGADIIGTRAGDQIIRELPLFEEVFSQVEITK